MRVTKVTLPIKKVSRWWMAAGCWAAVCLQDNPSLPWSPNAAMKMKSTRWESTSLLNECTGYLHSLSFQLAWIETKMLKIKYRQVPIGCLSWVLSVRIKECWSHMTSVFSWPRSSLQSRKLIPRTVYNHMTSLGSRKGLRIYPIRALTPKLDIRGQKENKDSLQKWGFFCPKAFFHSKLKITIF